MSTTHEEETQNAIDVQADLDKEYILSNGAELNQFFMDNLTSVEAIANILSVNWNAAPIILGALIKQQLENDLDEVCGDKARERVFG